MDTKNCSTLEPFVGALIADSLALAPHWIYDPSEIERKFGRVAGLLEPLEDSYHKGQPKGGQTHLGHQTIVLYEALRDGADFSDRLRSFWQDSSSYLDSATKNFLAGGNEFSNEMAGASRLAAVLATSSDDQVSSRMREQILVTHSETVAEAGSQLLEVVKRLNEGMSTRETVEDVFAGSAELAKAKDVEELNPAEALGLLGRSCALDAALPSVIYFLRRNTSYRKTLIDNVMAGGDSASRGLVLGALLVIAEGQSAIPDEWKNDLIYQITDS